jgi:large subunit ribosomal protein L29
MAKNKVNYNEMSADQLQELIAADKMRLTKMKFNHTVSPIDNPMDLRTLRRSIAKAMTALQSKLTAN